MKHKFTIDYSINAPLAVVVGAYLDCEHFNYLHTSVSKCSVLEYGRTRIRMGQFFKFLNIKVGHTFVTEYLPPSTFINYQVKPLPAWMPSIHHILKTESKVSFYPMDESKTLSVTTLEIDMPFFVYPFRNIIEKCLIKFKVLLDLEDVAMIARKERVYKTLNANYFLNKYQFILFKDEYVEQFGEKKSVEIPLPEEYKDKEIKDVFDLDFDYVQKFKKKRFEEICSYPFPSH